MGKLKLIRFFLGLIVVLILVVISFRFLHKEDKAVFSIYTVQVEGDYLNKLLKRTPSDYKSRFKQETIDRNNGFELINIINLKNPINSNYVVLKSEEELEFLKAYPFQLLESYDDSQEIKYVDHISHLIDLSVFNKYIKAAEINSKEAAIKTYLDLLTSNDIAYKLINSKEDIDSLIAKNPLETKDTLTQQEYDFVDIEQLDFTSGKHYFWIQNKGVVEFDFNFDEKGNLTEVNSKILGVIGNEFPSCC